MQEGVFESTNVESGNFETTNVESGNFETTNLESGNFETTNLESGNFETTNVQSTEGLLGATVGDSVPLSAYNPGNIIGYIEVDQLPEEYKGLTPTVKVLPIKIEKKELPPENKSNDLPPKDEIKKLKPLFPPGTEAFEIPNF